MSDSEELAPEPWVLSDEEKSTLLHGIEPHAQKACYIYTKQERPGSVASGIGSAPAESDATASSGPPPRLQQTWTASADNYLYSPFGLSSSPSQETIIGNPVFSIGVCDDAEGASGVQLCAASTGPQLDTACQEATSDADCKSPRLTTACCSCSLLLEPDFDDHSLMHHENWYTESLVTILVVLRPTRSVALALLGEGNGCTVGDPSLATARPQANRLATTAVDHAAIVWAAAAATAASSASVPVTAPNAKRCQAPASLPSLELIAPTQSTRLLSPAGSSDLDAWCRDCCGASVNPAAACTGGAAPAVAPTAGTGRLLESCATLPLIGLTLSADVLDADTPLDWEGLEAGPELESAHLGSTADTSEACAAASEAAEAPAAAPPQPAAEPQEVDCGDDGALLALLRARFYRCLGRRPPACLPADPSSPAACCEEECEEACGSCSSSAVGSTVSSAASSPLNGSPCWSAASSRNRREGVPSSVAAAAGLVGAASTIGCQA